MTKLKKRKDTKRMAMLSIILAFLLIQNFVPFLGNLPIPPINPTIIHVTVIVATIVLGTRDGMIAGLTWGVIRLIRAYTMPASPVDLLVWTNPFITIIPRVLIGLVTGLTLKVLKRLLASPSKWPRIIASVLGSLTNTIFVLLFMYLFMDQSMAQVLEVDLSNLLIGLISIIGVAGIAEAIIAGILAPMICYPLEKIYRRS